LPSRGSFVIGRGDSADVRIDHTSVSRRHAVVTLHDAAVTLEDLGSANGTWIAHSKIQPSVAVPLAFGALVEIGAVMLAVRPGSAAAGAPPNDPRVVFRDSKMEKLVELVDLVAQSRLSVILLGETGVGKDVLANRVHERSSRSRGSFVK